jgi:multimeric flavodoxin WrbA
MSMKILGITGSPRRGGNTDMLLAEMMRGAAGKGAEKKTLVLHDLNIAACHHCDFCYKAGQCHIKDDMQMVFKEFAAADRIILASPVQFMGITGEMKIMMDRGQAIWARKYILKIPSLEPVKDRLGFFISVGARKAANLFEPSLAIVKSYFHVLDVKYAGDLLVPGIDEKGAIAKRPEVLQQAFAAGQKMAE